HHDIYSIEDLAQLAFDLQAVHPTARISVKLVSQAGVGTIAAGVAKARVATVIISGADGGTGASPLGSIKHAGMPWEWGIAETQQVLVANRLRGRVRLRVDGGLRTGRDVLVAALLGGDEFSFGTSALIAAGCKMARTCHNDQCPVGIATQNPELRALFPGTPEHVASYLMLIAEEVRELLAMLGTRTLDEVIGRPDLLVVAPAFADNSPLDLTALLATSTVPADWPRRDMGEPNRPTGVDEGLDAELARAVRPHLDELAAGGAPLDIVRTVTNVDRTLGARLSGDIAEFVGSAGLAPGSVQLTLRGTAGQSLAAFGAQGLRISLEGAANDFVGKGLAGAEVDLRFAPDSALAAMPRANVIAGNACLYGATSGLLLVSGVVGERFAVRNSGADAVIEGAGDHLGEYMTGGTVVAIGTVGRNIASGMSGGALWLLDDDERLRQRLARTARIAEPPQADVDRLIELLRLHVERTGSSFAAELRTLGENLVDRFVFVVPA
ncbi:MAG: glutamate synthase large subunit, partial [Thermoleophilia bacterium]|nr:glutamate synthase large subunit [Thermoleophilia bacterium]